MAVKKTAKAAKTKYAIGIDLGGTNVVMVLVSQDGKLKSDRRFPTEAEKGPEYVISKMAANALEIIKEAGLKVSDVKCIGIGAPGPLDSRKTIYFRFGESFPVTASGKTENQRIIDFIQGSLEKWK